MNDGRFCAFGRIRDLRPVRSRDSGGSCATIASAGDDFEGSGGRWGQKRWEGPLIPDASAIRGGLHSSHSVVLCSNSAPPSTHSLGLEVRHRHPVSRQLIGCLVGGLLTTSIVSVSRLPKLKERNSFTKTTIVPCFVIDRWRQAQICSRARNAARGSRFRFSQS